METPERLIVDLGRLNGGKTEHLKGNLDPSLLELNDLEQLTPDGPVAYDLLCELLPEDELLVRGALRFPCACICSRCGCDYTDIFAEPTYCETFNVAGIENLDLTDSVREGIILALPSYPICKEDCEGICLRCGQDLNAGPCRCAEESDRSPWDALDELTPEA